MSNFQLRISIFFGIYKSIKENWDDCYIAIPFYSQLNLTVAIKINFVPAEWRFNLVKRGDFELRIEDLSGSKLTNHFWVLHRQLNHLSNNKSIIYLLFNCI